ncbi:SRPBCC domain-containing protein [Microlunatus sp. Gsoil 973]|uniref:SRPBCC family protein n=1 Tax=Microlunatus sp. Gsoil 973 TaxID=2672569 RepID=UPI0018A8666B|nr:SRPBCC domain-containing protein [Microlunatus sp. Gsoil 973]
MIRQVDRQFTITRIFQAPRDLVFTSWTDPDHLQWWLGPYRSMAPVPDLIMDVRPGGRFQVRVIEDDTGSSHVSGGIYHEIVRPEKLVFSWGFPADDPASSPLVTVLLNDLGDGGTEMIFHLHLPPTLPESVAEQWISVGIRPGWLRTIDRLVEQLS